ncbi:hypothetical protein SKAU_G00328050 [Synaphobranchus kaupii]|uniref:Active breakpoint cluster region-related protein n=1 Tax=Synaphobranchus kaupii TaxID=118154 RepID=A0A9Q1EQ46_SYNKA|nr:hypothetical protein SKAU_G00328050 [Synaphobranchus kaupii]
MWEQDEFEKHWRNEFPDGEVPKMNLKSVEDIETELEKCKKNLKKLQQALSEEKFKVIYLQTTIARQKSYDKDRWDTIKDDKLRVDSIFTKSEKDKRVAQTSRRIDGDGMKVPIRKKNSALAGKSSEDHGGLVSARNSQTGKPVPVPPRKKPIFKMDNAATSGTTQPDGNCVSSTEKTNVGCDKEASDHEYEDVELNDHFVRVNLVAPKVSLRESFPNPHRDALRPLRQSRDLDSSDDGRLSPAGMRVAYRLSRGSDCSTSDRRSDGYLSSDHEDSSSADFNYNTDGYDGDAAEDRKSQDGSETMPFIDESPTMSPQLCARGPDGEAMSPTPHEGLLPGGDIEKGLEMKKLVLSGFLASEEIYINQLDALLLPMKPLKGTATTSQPVLTVQQIETIFYKVQDIFEIHKEFYDALYPHIQQWDDKVTVGHLFQKLASQLGVYKAFVDNYKAAVETVEKCGQANSQFQKISENLKVKGPKDSKDCTTGWLRGGGYRLACALAGYGRWRALRDATEGRGGDTNMEILLILRLCCNCTYALLYKPIDRVTRSTLVLHDLLKHTPKDHPDFPLLQDALRISQNFLSSINEEIDPRRTAVTTPKGEARQLVKDGFLVEVSEGSRKLRHVFLFTDLLLCAKMKKTAVGKHQQYDCKWYIPLADLTLQTLDDSDACPHVQTMPEHEIEEMKTKISAIKSEIQKEKKALKGPSRALDRLRKKMNEQESCLLLHSPTIPFRIHNKHGKSYLFLLSSDYERSEWKEAVQKLLKKDLQVCVLSSVELQVLTGSCFKLRTVHNIPVTCNKDDEETPGLYGFLHVIVHSAKGFKESANLYCTLEVDSFGYFVSKAKTRVFRDTTEPQWNEEFEIELEGSQCLRILCYEKCYDKSKLNKDNNEIVDKIMGKGQVQGEKRGRARCAETGDSAAMREASPCQKCASLSSDFSLELRCLHKSTILLEAA